MFEFNETLEQARARNIRDALAEDIGRGDWTARLVPEAQRVRSRVIVREAAVLCGRDWFDGCVLALDPGARIAWQADEGARLSAGDTLCEIEANARALLSAERPALNFLQLSAIRLREFPFDVPLFVENGQGCRLIDLDGNEYIDYVLGYGALILGHSPKAVNDAVIAQLAKGTMFGASCELESLVSEKVAKMVPCIDLLRFTSSGTEALHFVLRLARAFTGREKVIKFEGHYHGWVDDIFISVHPSPPMGLPNTPWKKRETPGQPEDAGDNLILLSWNDLGAVEKILKHRSHEIAAIIMEPIMFNNGGIYPQKGYLEGVRDLTTKYGVVLIFDEVVTGFRHGVHFPAARAPASGAIHLPERLQFSQGGRAHLFGLHVQGQDHGQVRFGDRHRATGLAVDNGDGRAPVALPGHPPVAQPVVHRLATPAALGEPGGDGVERLLRGQAVEGGGVAQRALVDIRAVLDPALAPVSGEDHLLDGDAEARGELPVALVVRRHGHHGAGAVTHQHEVRGVDRDPLAGDGVDRVEAERQALLLHRLQLGLRGSALAALLDEGGEHRAGGGRLERERVLRGHGDVGHAEQRVGARREDGEDLVAAGDAEIELHADNVASLVPRTTGAIEIQLRQPPPEGWKPPIHIKVEYGQGVSDVAALKKELEALIREKLIFRADLEMVPADTLPKYEYKAKLVRKVYEEERK